MRKEAKERYVGLIRELRGAVSWMYWFDGCVRIGADSPLKTLQRAQELPFHVKREGVMKNATRAEIQADYYEAKICASVGKEGMRDVSKLRVADEIINLLVANEVEERLKDLGLFFRFHEWNWQAQLMGVLIPMTYVRGNHELMRAYREQDWDLAARVYDGNHFARVRHGFREAAMLKVKDGASIRPIVDMKKPGGSEPPGSMSA